MTLSRGSAVIALTMLSAIFCATASGGYYYPPSSPPVSQPPASTQLSVTKAGSGSGTVTSSPGGIDCGSDCSEAYPGGTSVTLTAQAAPGSVFVGWAGCPGSATTCTVTVGASAAMVTATFDLATSATGTADTAVEAELVSVTSIRAPGGKRHVSAKLSLDEEVEVTMTLLRSGVPLATKHLSSLQPGDRTATMRIPASVAKGRATLRVVLQDDASNTLTLTRSTKVKSA